jgi:hypothetical protein
MLRQLNKYDLFELYDSDLVLRLRNTKNLSDTGKDAGQVQNISEWSSAFTGTSQAVSKPVCQ